MLNERPNAVTWKGKSYTVIGPALAQSGSVPAPDFRVLGKDLAPLSPLPFPQDSTTWLIYSAPSLDQPATQKTIRRLGQLVAEASPTSQMWVVTMDPPAVLSRYDKTFGERIWLASDQRDGSFGRAYGTLIKELNQLAPSVFVCDHHGTLWYAEYLKDLDAEPDYKAADSALKTMYI